MLMVSEASVKMRSSLIFCFYKAYEEMKNFRQRSDLLKLPVIYMNRVSVLNSSASSLIQFLQHF